MGAGVVDMRLLELRSGLFFEYPKLNSEDKTLMFFLPFWENPIIRESKEAHLVEYDLINRGSTLFAHTGAKSRDLTIEFYLTLPHIMNSMNSVLNAQRLIKTLSTEKEKRRFDNINPFESEVKTTVAEDVIRHWKELVIETQQEYIGPYPRRSAEEIVGGTGMGENPNLFPGLTGQPPPGTGTVLADTSLNTPPIGEKEIQLNASPTALRAINSAVYILNTIRTSVAGNSITSVLGPPVLRLRHGASYNDVPLVCRSFDISVEEDAGYDLKTLRPHRIRISLPTSELRGGDFTDFGPGAPIKRDNIAGWEALFEYGTTDPGYLQ